jgi:sulfide dehydrogenase cytochrome subunit
MPAPLAVPGSHFRYVDCGSARFHQVRVQKRCNRATTDDDASRAVPQRRLTRATHQCARCDYAKRPNRQHYPIVFQAMEFAMRAHSGLPVVLFAFAASIAVAQAPDPNLARNIAAGCASCHGTTGVSNGGMPSLAGQAKADLVRKMQEFKAGRMPATVMTQLAKGYTDEQIDLVAGWFGAQKP